ncbi:MAG: hypothetical protein C0613_03390 [Desulfobulbaceae bacterium]|nr:MAG: hypothetical protein C0613_03390 [Desulfobulbaceae bacterium]
MNEKQQATLIVSIIIAMLVVALLWQGSSQHAQTLETQIRAAETELQSTITTMEAFSFKPYQQRIKNLINTSPQIIEAFAARDRQALHEAALPRYRALQNENKFFKVMHFHLPDGRTLLRMHKPEFYGDDLTKIRPLVTAVHKSSASTAGFEVGRSGAFYRVVEPIFHEGTYVGALEFGILAHQALDLLEKIQGLQVTLFFSAGELKKSLLFDLSQVRTHGTFQVVCRDKEIFRQLPDSLRLDKSSQRLSLGDKSYILHTRPIFKDFRNREIGGVLVLQDISAAIAGKKTYLARAITFSLLMLTITLFVIYFYFNKVMGVLLDEIKQRKKTETALRTSEQRFRFLVHDLPKIAVQGYDMNRRVTLWNRGSELLYGYSSKEAMGRQLEELIIPAEMRDRVIDAITGWFDLNIPIPASEVTLRNKEGEPVHVFSSHALTHSRDGKPELYCIDIDLQELKKAQDKQIAMENKLHRAQKMEAIGLMAGGVAHDLNNILSGIVSYPELLLMQLPPDSPLRNPLEIIKESGSRAAAVVADLLTVARGVAKTTEVANPNTFITAYQQSPEYLELCRRHPHVTLVTDLAPDLKNIRCSSVHIMKVITNLVNNAAEAIADQGTITISSRAERLENFFAIEHDIVPGDYAVITICDTGPGIIPADLSKIFEPFFTKKHMGRSGTGLGLTVVWNTMRDHGGVVTTESSPAGTCFTLYLPICEEEITSGVMPENMADLQGQGQRILVVDDDKQQRLICGNILSSLGYQVQVAASGEEAVHYMTDNSADLLVLDMIMDPGINGKETYQRICALHPGQKAIIASGFSLSDEVKETLALGAGSYIKKPYSLAQLGRAVKNELRR